MCRRAVSLLIACLFQLILVHNPVSAHVGVPQIFSSNMVLQQKHENRVWGWGDPGDTITVSIAYQTKKTQVGTTGRWEVLLDPVDAGGPYRMVISGHNEIVFDNVMFGEVWVCSGQSNMAWPVSVANDGDLESLTAKFPNIRLISVPRVGTDEPQDNFEGEWQICTPQTVTSFSAVGYFFGRQLHQSLDVPIGLIDNAWGGSACEAWINRNVLEQDERFTKLMDHWKQIEQAHRSGKVELEYRQALAEWEVAAAAAKQQGTPVPNKPRRSNAMVGNQRPSNIYNGVLRPTIGYGIRGVIWYQGESNASRAHQYRELFPLMISTWRNEWNQGAFPFYWVQLADYRDEQPNPGPSDWAELREAQSMTMSQLPNTGEAVIIDIGEANDIHPTNKQDVAKRLARLALARDYGFEQLAHRSPRFLSFDKNDDHIVLTFQFTGGGLDTFDVDEPRGFTIAGEDRVFHHAKAEFIGKGAGRTQIKVWSDAVTSPVAVRYAWADNPVCNVRSREGLPLTPFRTDDWPGITVGQRTR